MAKTFTAKKTSRIAAITLSVAMLLSGAVLAQTSFASADEGTPLFKSDYSTKAEAVQAGLDLNEQIAEEGMILLKNVDSTLPLTTSATNKTKVTVLGYAGVNPNAGFERKRRRFVCGLGNRARKRLQQLGGGQLRAQSHRKRPV